jgi:hypothetical protein
LTVFVKRFGIARSGACTRTCTIDFHVSTSRYPFRAFGVGLSIPNNWVDGPDAPACNKPIISLLSAVAVSFPARSPASAQIKRGSHSDLRHAAGCRRPCRSAIIAGSPAETSDPLRRTRCGGRQRACRVTKLVSPSSIAEQNGEAEWPQRTADG